MSLLHFHPESNLSRTNAASQAANCRDDDASHLRRETRLQCWLLNGSGVRDTARVLHVSPTTGIKELKKLAHLKPLNQRLLKWLKPESVEVEIDRVEDAGIEESELDKMWTYVGKKTNPRWLWHAIDRNTGQVLAYVSDRRKDEVFLQLKQLLEAFRIHRYCTDSWGAVAYDI